MFVNLGDLMTLVVCLALDPAGASFPQELQRHQEAQALEQQRQGEGLICNPLLQKWWLLKG